MLRSLGLDDKLDVILTREDAERPKPDPEIYLSACRLLRVSPCECIAIEDSTAGVRAALAAGIRTVGVATPFTRDALREAKLLPPVSCFVEEPGTLVSSVERCLDNRGAANS